MQLAGFENERKEEPCQAPQVEHSQQKVRLCMWAAHNMAQLTWLVTGCSSGFGENFVYEIIARGDRVVATARMAKERLGPLRAAGAFVLDLDLTWPQQQIDGAIRQAIDVYGSIDVLVNNAGYVEMGLVEEIRYVEPTLAGRRFIQGDLARSLVHLYLVKRGF